jgi:hypothetical protein
MMPGVSGSLWVDEIHAVATDGQRSPEQWAAIAAGKMIRVADRAPPAIRDQAHAFRAALTRVIANYIRMAIEEDRVLLAGRLEREGHGEIAHYVRNR